jgi:hypothetical protein
MELKGCRVHIDYTAWPKAENPFNGIESKLEVVDFNKTHAKESIQWN